ncbi:non-ribosomal peptide synthetase [Catellatospora tritici]|uniref:non-ribosomal peptide synthetase n=1 Tax=Catellatospora tritici TaxID=2851566 RepID=UPI001C2DA666|nr:non-ribosomal peptide synthetase [Catellatospora tritici]MBV1850533.1 non-ribosomal peptide synthetase [Catellatospora tritici]
MTALHLTTTTQVVPGPRKHRETVGIEPVLVAAFLAVLHRFTAQARIAADCRSADGDTWTVTADFDDLATFGELADTVAAQLLGLGPDGLSECGYDAAPGGFVLAPDVATGGWPYRVTGTGATDPRVAAAVDGAFAVAAAHSAGARHQPVAQLRLAEDEDRLRALGFGDGAPPPARCVHELVAEQASRNPEAVAVSRGAETLTYAQLDQQADTLAARLRDRGVGEGDVVAVLQGRSPSIVVTLLGILKAGAAYLVLDPQDTPVRHARLIHTAGARLAVAENALLDLVPEGVPALDLDAAGQGQSTAAPAPVGQNPDTLAYVSFTSGTTGEPRGVGVPHRAISRLVRDPNWIDIAAADVFLLLAPIAFDASTLEIWAPLVNGCRLAVAPDGVLELDRLADVLKQEAVSVLWLTAGLFHQLAATRLDAFGGIRHLVAGGDVISPGHLERLLQAHPRLVFTNGYGPTENTTFTTCWTTTAAPASGPVPIGHPITGTRVAVLDTALRPVPTGCWGELYAAGDGLARGYVNSAQATADRFLPDTFSGRPGARMYRTGDLARWSADGVLEFLGRVDNQLKIQGFRVEPNHVEAELTRLPEVLAAAVVAQSDDAGGKRLLAYVVVAEQTGTDDEGLGVRLRERLRQTLPPYAVPWAIVVLDELPLTANGKVDRRALPVASRMPRNVGNDFVEPRDTVERRLAALWGEVLGVEPIGADDDFFDMGGHSLLAAELLGTLKEGFGVDVPARVLYLQPTIAELAQHLRD